MFFFNKKSNEKKYCDDNTHVFDISKTNKILTVFENGKYIDKPVMELKAICNKCGYVINGISEYEILKHGRINEYYYYKIIELLENDITHSFVSRLLKNELNNEFYYSNFKNNIVNYSLFDYKNSKGDLSKKFFEEAYSYVSNISVKDINYDYKINYVNNNILDLNEDIIITSINEHDIKNSKILNSLIGKYDVIYNNYLEYINNVNEMDKYGNVIYSKVDNKIIASCFTTKNYMINYDLIFKCFNNIFKYACNNKLSIGVSINYIETLDEKMTNDFKNLIYILGLIYDVNVNVYMV